ncbi:hypothetical protein Golomagni_05539 [Golovinomyces magnicellulatus]|nr:hypothetical protein Golomagni_05539 [Golovinomyces magnicellulatus]
MASTIDKDNAREAEKNDIVVDQDTSPALSHRTSIDQPKDTGSDTANEKSSDVGNGVLATQPEDQPDKEIEYIHGLKLASVMLALTLATFLMLLDVSILVTAIPRITTQFHSLPDVGWYGAAYNLASAALQPVAGKLYTHLPVKLIGALMGFCQVGLVAGPLIGGALTQYSTWRWCFYLNLPIGAITAIIMLIVTLPDYRAQQKVHPGPLTLKKLDLPGFFIFAPFAIMILLALEFGGDKYPWKSATEIGLFCGGGVALGLFILWERHVGEGAMIPLSILMKRQVWASCLSGI